MDNELYKAAVRGNQNIFKQAHDEKYFLRQTNQQNNYLHIAIRHKQHNFTRVALESFPGLNKTIEELLCQKNCNGKTPIHVAVEAGNMPIINLLLEYKNRGLWRVRDNEDNTPLHTACIYGRFKVAEALLKVLEPVVTQDINKYKETPLHLAIKHQSLGDKKKIKNIVRIINPEKEDSIEGIVQETLSLPIIKLLLKTDILVSCWQDTNGFTPLLRAASLAAPYDVNVITAIVSGHPQSAEVCDFSGKTILHHLNRKLNYLEAQTLLGFPEIKSLGNYRDQNGNTPAHVAVQNNDLNFVRVLMDCSEDFLVVNNEGLSAADLIEQKQDFQDIGTYELTKEEVEAIAELEEMEAVAELDVEFLWQKLGSKGRVFLLSRAPTGQNILHLFMQRVADVMMIENVLNIIKKILEYPNLLWGIDRHENTPLHYFVNHSLSIQPNDIAAILKICDKCVKSREEWESPWRMKNDDGNTPLHLAALQKSSVVVEIWNKDNEVADYTNNRLETPLHLLPECVYMDVAPPLLGELVRYGIRSGAAEKRDVDGLTPFLRAHKSLKKGLIDLYCDEYRNRSVMLDSHPDGENTALHLALQNGQFYLAERYLSSLIPAPSAAAADADALSYGPSFLYPPAYKDVLNKLLEKPNSKGVTPSDLIGSLQHLPSHFEEFLMEKGLLVGFRSMYGVPMSKVGDYTNTIGVIAALLATVTFTAAFTVPGGLNQDNGTPILLKKAAFQVFMGSNLLALCLSMMVLFCLLWIMTTQNRKLSILLVDASIMLLQLSFYATLLTFMTGVYVTTINITPWIAILSCALCSLLILLMHRWFIEGYLGPWCTSLILRTTQIRSLVKTKLLNDPKYVMTKVQGGLEYLKHNWRKLRGN